MVQNTKGQFIEGNPGGPGRPKGSKNQITLYKLMAEEAFRDRNAERIATVLDMIVQDALDGDKTAKKLVWDAAVSKANMTEDKTSGSKQEITVHRMQVVPRSDVDNTNEENDNE
jgi:hypothetical protein